MTAPTPEGRFVVVEPHGLELPAGMAATRTRPLDSMGAVLTVAQVAEAIGMHPNWVRQHFRPLYHLGSKGFKAFQSDVEAFLAVSRVWGTTDGPATLTEMLAVAKAEGYWQGAKDVGRFVRQLTAAEVDALDPSKGKP